MIMRNGIYKKYISGGGNEKYPLSVIRYWNNMSINASERRPSIIIRIIYNSSTRTRDLNITRF
jgi:hypothetical protein